MRKGVSGLQNIQLLKWCKEFGITPRWNLIWGFPGEQPDEHERMAGLVRRLTHLPPPSASAIRLDRFSPNFDRRRAPGVRGRPTVSGLPAYLSFQAGGRRKPRLLLQLWISRAPGRRALHGWRCTRSAALAAAPPGWLDLFSIDLGSVLLVCDLRPGREALVPLSGLQRVLSGSVTPPARWRRCSQKARDATSTVVSAVDLEALLDPLLKRDMMVQEGTSYLSLAIPVGEYSPGAAARRKLQHLLATSASDRACTGQSIRIPERTTAARV